MALALFNFLEHFPFSSVLSFIAMAMVIVFVTSADSGAMVVDTWHQVEWQHTRLAANILGLAHGHAVLFLLAGGPGAL
ncbi:BCCT family transporter [Escherichia coli]|uniref:BCCT family transporter n=1 Tax=Escherichia coli TaxID=562 RepID=UPI00208E86E7|nr:BCCT family transporter [Escherichia coli]